jgi:AraC-like DNA-binding protein
LDLEDGSVIGYGPGAEHTGANNEGLSFAFTVASGEALDERAHTLGVCVELPAAGMVLEMGARPGLEPWVDLVLGPYVSSQSRNAGLNLDEMLSAMVLAFRQPLRSPRPSHGPRRWDDRGIVHRCIDLAEALQRRPTLSELCAVSRVSERRLRTAFANQFDTSPAAFFRLWALTVARRRLSDVEGSSQPVTRTSLDLGFGHLSRFAQYYQQVYGESPSVTARASRLPARL